MAITKLSKDLAVIAKLDDEPNDVGGLSPAGLKSKFDENGLAIQSYLNDVLLPALEGLTGAENIGGSVDSVTVKTVQAILSAFETRIAERYTKAEDNALVGAETKDLVKSVDLNLTTGVLTVVKKDGTTLSWDTALEKVPANFVLEETAAGTFLVITNVDGSTSRANLGDLVDTYTFNNGDQIAFNTTGAANNKTITATIRANSIGIDKLTLSAVGQLEGYVSAASGSATAAAGSASAADKSKLAAETAKTGAETAQKNAETAKTAAESAKTAAALSESGSAENARIAGVKATEASGSAAAALASKNAAAGSATAADTSAKTAETAKTAAGNAAGAADASATAAAGSAGAAATAKAAAETAKTGAETAQRNAETAKTAAESAKTAAAGSETGAAGSAKTATEKAKTATDKATLAQSYAVGGTGTRVGEDLDNAKYYKDQAQAIVGGDYPTKAEAQGYATTAKDAAISAASTDATAKANAAIKSASADATAKADAARDAAKAASVPLAQKGAAGGVAPLGADGMIPLQHIPEEAKEQRVVANIAARDAIGKKFVGLSVYVKDATADPTVKRGGAYYLWDGAWNKTAEAESMDVSLTWDNVEGKPATFPPSGHSHSVSDVTGALRAFAPVSITLPVGSWTAAAPYTQTVSVAGVLASWDHRLGLSPQRIADRTAEKANDKAMGCITYCDTIDGGITVTCRDKKPETNILVVLAGEV